MIDVIHVGAGETLAITFKGQSGGWRQGIWLAVVGQMQIAGVAGDQMTLWTDTAPSKVDVNVIRSEDGLLRIYNIWDSARGLRQESQSATSGMLKQANGDVVTYRCNDIGFHPTFEKLIFEIRRVG